MPKDTPTKLRDADGGQVLWANEGDVETDIPASSETATNFATGFNPDAPRLDNYNGIIQKYHAALYWAQNNGALPFDENAYYYTGSIVSEITIEEGALTDVGIYTYKEATTEEGVLGSDTNFPTDWTKLNLNAGTYATQNGVLLTGANGQTFAGTIPTNQLPDSIVTRDDDGNLPLDIVPPNFYPIGACDVHVYKRQMPPLPALDNYSLISTTFSQDSDTLGRITNVYFDNIEGTDHTTTTTFSLPANGTWRARLYALDYFQGVAFIYGYVNRSGNIPTAPASSTYIPSDGYLRIVMESTQHIHGLLDQESIDGGNYRVLQSVHRDTGAIQQILSFETSTSETVTWSYVAYRAIVYQIR